MVYSNKVLLFQCLLVCRKDDQVFECLRRAADKAGFDTSICHTHDTVLEEFQARFHDLVLVDTRSTKTDTETICRSVGAIILFVIVGKNKI